MEELYLDQLEHSGVAHDENPPGRGSGRYGYGTGDHPNQREAFSNPDIENMTYEQWKQSRKEKPNPIDLPEKKRQAAIARAVKEYQK